MFECCLSSATYFASDRKVIKMATALVSHNSALDSTGGWECLGIAHTKLTYRFEGRAFRLTDVAGNVVEKLLG